jgi:SNF2 family DNA or RNA helicase
MKVNSVRLLKTEVLKDLPPITYDPIYYELDPAHARLYRALAEEQLLPLKDGGKIDATTVQTLHHALQQIVCNWDYFADDPSLSSAGFDLVDELLEELAGKKLIVFASYRMTNRALVKRFAKKHGAVAAFGDLTVPQQQRNIMKFIDDPTCRLFIGQPTSMGVGVDGLQHVCSDAIFLELPPIPKDFHQAVARLWRDGQTARGVSIRVAVAEKTLQVRKMKSMLDKDALVNRVQRSYEDLRNSIFGD